MIKEKKFILLSNNCWGYELYHTLKRNYNTPLVGLYFHPNCYIKFLNRLEESLTADLSFSNRSKYTSDIVDYPVGILLDDIEIHFLHYKSSSEAKQKWERRASRMKTDLIENVPVYAKFCDREGCTKEHLRQFHETRIKYKLSLGINSYESPNHITCAAQQDPEADCVVDGDTLYKNRYQYFDIVHWIKTGQCKTTRLSAQIAKLAP